jgi:hypothetical protein
MVFITRTHFNINLQSMPRSSKQSISVRFFRPKYFYYLFSRIRAKYAAHLFLAVRNEFLDAISLYLQTVN